MPGRSVMKYRLCRPESLATDDSGSYEVLQHALSFYQDQGIDYDAIVLLQATSPFRERKHLEEALPLFDRRVDMVVSVTESAFNPYYNLFEENERGLLKISKGKESIYAGRTYHLYMPITGQFILLIQPV